MGKNLLKLEIGGFEEYIAKLEDLEADIKPIVTEALNKAGEKVTSDTIAAVSESNLPRGGKYSSGETKKSILQNPQTSWSGYIAEIGVGFDFSRPGAGGFLITGTLRIPPDKALKKIYKGKKYMKDVQQGMCETFQKEIAKRMGG